MKRLILLVLLLGGFSSGFAQTLTLKNGTTVSADGLVRQGDMVMVSVKSSTGKMGQIGFQVADIAQLNFPAPDAMATATNLIAQGLFDRALAQIEPVVAYQKTIQDIPGNWWAKAALVQVSALCELNRADEAKALVSEIVSSTNDPEILASAKLRVTLITQYKDPQEALTAYDALINESTEPLTLSQAWIAEGDIHLAQHEFDDALLAYLTVTVFYAKDNPLVPKALWGSGQAYSRLKDAANATKTFQQLISDYPDSPEASLAKAELMKKEKKT